MKKSKIIFAAIAFIATAATLLGISSCKKTESVVTPNAPGNEFLTTVILQCFNKSAPFDTATSVYRVDPSNTVPPDTSHAILNFHKSSTYSCNVYILDEHSTPVAQCVKYNTFNINSLPSTTVNVTDEIRARQNYHLICFDLSGAIATNMTVTRTDYDTNSPPLQVGLNDNIVTTNISTGRMEATLHHQPNVKNGTCGPGSVDFDIFNTININ